MARLKSRRILIKDSSEEVKQEEELVYCRRCEKHQKKTMYHSALDLDLDKNLLMSICKNCVNDIFDRYLISSGNNLSEALYKTCRTLNIMFLERVVDSLKLHLAKKEAEGKEIEIFGIYKSHLGRWLSLNKGVPGTFNDNSNVFNKSENQNELENESVEDKEYLISMWGEGLSSEDYSFLERELSNWKRSHSSDTYAETVLLKEICYIQLDLKKARIENRDTSALLKKLLESMKTSALDPAKANQASSGSGKETWGMFLKVIEETTPAEYFADKELFKDFDNIDIYFQNYIKRPAMNFYSSTHNLELLESTDDGETDVVIEKSEEEEGE